MIEVNGIYKLKKIKNFIGRNDESNYKVIEMEDKLVVCENLDGENKGKRYLFCKDFLIDPDYPNDIYSSIINVSE
jgi:hypothetical protein